jgi:hypothetical protein
MRRKGKAEIEKAKIEDGGWRMGNEWRNKGDGGRGGFLRIARGRVFPQG